MYVHILIGTFIVFVVFVVFAWTNIDLEHK